MFVFSVEDLDAGGAVDTSDNAAGAAMGYHLMPSRRYAHRAAYLQQLAQAQGFAPPQIERAPLREENGQAVQGLLVTLRPR